MSQVKETNGAREAKLTQPEKLTVLASKRISEHPELYKIVDMCNRTLRDRGIIFGLSKNGSEMTVTIYEV
ncbi:MAG: YpmA family protein [Bacillota bacterium]